jgi:hypothetical protein
MQLKSPGKSDSPAQFNRAGERFFVVGISHPLASFPQARFGPAVTSELPIRS